MSLPAVPLTVDGVRCAVAASLPGAAGESMRDLRTPVPVRSLTVTVSAPPSAAKLDLLDAVEIHGDVADVAGEPHRLPLAEMSMFSLMLAPLNTIVSLPRLPSTVSLPSPGSQLEGVVAGAQQRDVVAAAAVTSRCRHRRAACRCPGCR